MIQTQTLDCYPIFGTQATKIQPDTTKMINGFLPADVYPAEWANWAWYKNSKGIADLNVGTASMERELVTLLTCAGETPTSDTTCNDQVYKSILHFINTCATGYAPTAHASSATTYGVGTADCYGHLKISDTYTSVLQACAGVAASQCALATVYGLAAEKAAVGNTIGCEDACNGGAGTATTAARSDHVHPYPRGLKTTDESGCWYGRLVWNESLRKYSFVVTNGGATYGVVVNSAANDGSGCPFGSAARCDVSCFRASSWTPSYVENAGCACGAKCVHTTSDSGSWYVYSNYQSESQTYYIDIGQGGCPTGGSRYRACVYYSNTANYATCAETACNVNGYSACVTIVCAASCICSGVEVSGDRVIGRSVIRTPAFNFKRACSFTNSSNMTTSDILVIVPFYTCGPVYVPKNTILDSSISQFPAVEIGVY